MTKVFFLIIEVMKIISKGKKERKKKGEKKGKKGKMMEWRDVREQGRIHGNPVADGWAGAVMQKPLRIKQGRIHGHQLRTGGQGRKCEFSHFSTRA